MGSVPLLTSLSDPRNLLTLGAFIAALLLVYRGLLDIEVGTYNEDICLFNFILILNLQYYLMNINIYLHTHTHIYSCVL